MTRRHGLFVTLLLVVLAGTAHAGWPRVPEPPFATMEQIGGNMDWNTVPMRISLFHSKLDPERVLAFYRDRWSDAFVEDRYGPWQQISRQEGEYFITVQVRPDAGKGSDGRISIMHLHERPVQRPGTGVPMLQGSEVINDLASNDAGRRARTVALINHFSLQSNRDFYRRHFVEQGWGVTLEREVDGGGAMAVYRNGSDEVTVLVNQGPRGTTVLVNEVRAGGWFSW